VEYELWIVAMTKNFEVSVLMTKKRRKEDRKNGVEKWRKTKKMRSCF